MIFKLENFTFYLFSPKIYNFGRYIFILYIIYYYIVYCILLYYYIILYIYYYTIYILGKLKKLFTLIYFS